ncbi:cupredoxin domain-containing protein [Methylovulum psychrotolerans]|nr:cupredoxin domain-containing protein [Methylovulum psychrotolerans]
MNRLLRNGPLSLLLLAPLLTNAAASTDAATQIIVIKANCFAFQPAKIALKKGQTVILELSSTDKRHGFFLPDFGIRADVMPGKTVRIRFTPDKIGTFISVAIFFAAMAMKRWWGKLSSGKSCRQ